VRWVLLAVALLLTTGCFDSDRDQTELLTRVEYVKQANAICRDWGARIDALGKAPAGRRAREKHGRRAGALARAKLAELRRLRAPPRLQPMVREFQTKVLTLARQSGRHAKALAKVEADIRNRRFSSAQAKAHLQALTKAQRALLATIEQMRDLLRRLGLTDCASYN
jgi:hypothetical protein